MSTPQNKESFSFSYLLHPTLTPLAAQPTHTPNVHRGMAENMPVGDTPYFYQDGHPPSPNHRKRRQDQQYQPTENATSFQAISDQWQQQQQQQQQQQHQHQLGEQQQAVYHDQWQAQAPHPQQLSAMHQPPALDRNTLGHSDDANILFMDQMRFQHAESPLGMTFPGSPAFPDPHTQDMGYLSARGFQKQDDQGYLELHTPSTRERDSASIQLQSWNDHPAYTSSHNPILSPSTPTFFSSAFLEALQEDQAQPPSYDFHGTPEGVHPTLASQNWSAPPPPPHPHPPHSTAYGQELPGYVYSGQRPADMMPDRPSPHLGSVPSPTSLPQPSFGKHRNAGIPMPLHQESLRQANASAQSPPISPALKRSSSSSSSSSPPVTPMYGRLSNLSIRPDAPATHAMSFAGTPSNYYGPQPPILERDEHPPFADDPAHLAIDTGPASPGTVQSAPRGTEQHALKTRLLIQSYLQTPNPVQAGERTVVIMTSKVAQKSYGTEKRFLCPPPTAFLIGTQWWTARTGQDDESIPAKVGNTSSTLTPPALSVCISGESSVQAGQVEWYTASGATADPIPQPGQTVVDGHGTRKKKGENRPNEQWDEVASGRCVAKNLYISDADEKRKRVECLVRIQLANGMLLGTASSRGIKVISKPSKKRQSVKNMDLCIHHGTAVSLFNRIRSQTVSTKYLGVSTASGMPYSLAGSGNATTEGTCFVARTAAWDPFVIWVVDRSCVTRETKSDATADDYIAARSTFTHHMPYPPPPAIALKNTSDDLIPIHYNQHVVLQCLSTGLVSPVMVIRKVDKASTVVGGAQCRMTDPSSMSGGGEFGDEVLGDPVSQLHKVAFQIVPHAPAQVQNPLDTVGGYGSPNLSMPRTSLPVTYLACLNDVVGMHKTTAPRAPIHPQTISWEEMTSQEGGRVVRKRRVSTDVLDRHLPLNQRLLPSASLSSLHSLYSQEAGFRRRVNSMNDGYDAMQYPSQYAQQQGPCPPIDRTRSVSISVAETMRPNPVNSPAAKDMFQRRLSLGQSNSTPASAEAYWHEDVSDAAVWTIVGTDCATYTLWTPPSIDAPSPVALPLVSHYTLARGHGQPCEDGSGVARTEWIMSLHGESFSRDLEVWFGDVKATRVEYRSHELMVCFLPSQRALMQGIGPELAIDKAVHKVPILLVRGDGIIVKTGQMYQF